jgi:hypothetical protein
MTVAAKLSGFLAVLAAVFGVAFLTGTQSAALLAPPSVHDNTLGGLSGSVDGYTLTTVEPELEPGPDQFVELRLTDPDGAAVTELDQIDSMPAAVHLFAVRRDLAGFQHVMPTPGEQTSWWALLSLTPGPWRVVVELQPKALNRPIMLGVDLTVRGDYRPEPLPPAAGTITVNGVQARISGGLSTRAGAQIGVRVSADGRPVRDLQPSHGAAGHAVVVRPGDLAMAHRHATSGGSGPRLEFAGGVPQPGTYVVFVEFYRADRQDVLAYTAEARR